jgi:hypothetical protein
LITSDSGFSVEVLGRTGLRYTEDDRTMLIDSEVLARHGIGLYRWSLRRWEPPNDSLPIDEDERNRIVENIRQAFMFNGDELVVI